MTIAHRQESIEALTPRRFLQKFNLPRCARVIPQNGDLSLLGQRVLLYKYYKSNRVEAALEDKGGGYLVIPQLYEGWFSVVTERGQIKARCYTTIQRLVSFQVSSFLTVTDVIAYTLNSKINADGKKQHYCKTTIKGGNVLKLLAVYQDVNSQTAKSKRLSWPLIAKSEASRYAQCLTAEDQVIYIPVTTTGQFYATANNTRDDSISKVYQLSRLLKTFPLPVRVCIINGCKAQGSMVLENYRTEEVILACSLGKENRFLEIDVNSKFYIVDDQLRPKDHDIRAALQYTRLNWDKWRRQLKVAHHIYPKKPEYENLDRLSKISISKSSTSSSKRMTTNQLEMPYVQVKDRIEEALYAEISEVYGVPES